MGLAYIRFGLDNPEPYRMLFMTRADDTPDEYKAVVLGDNAAFEQVRRCAQECIDAGRFRPGFTDAYRLAIGFWARVHGLTSLLIAKPQFPWPADRGRSSPSTQASAWPGSFATSSPPHALSGSSRQSRSGDT